MQRNGQKTRLKKIEATGFFPLSPQLFWQKVFDMGFPQKNHTQKEEN
jgi:hypothetical protein